jgi:hypothetical protein
LNYELALKKIEQYLSVCEASLRVQAAMPTRYSHDPSWQEYDRQIVEGCR